MKNLTTLPAQRASGRYKVQVVAPGGRIVVDRPWAKNLILNQGLNAIATRQWADCFVSCAGGSGNTPVADDSGSTTASQTGTTVTASGSIFSAGDVGRVIRWDAGSEAVITAYTSGTVVTVDRSQSVSSGEFTVYRVEQVGLVSEIKRNDSYLTGSGNCGTAIVSNEIQMKRTYEFAPESVGNGGAKNYAELGFSWLGTAGNNLFSRVLIAGGTVNVPVDYQLRVIYELRLSIDPDTLSAKTAVITGWPVAPATVLTGDEQLVEIAVAIVDTDGNTEGGGARNTCLEPSVGCNVFLSSVSTAPATFGTTDARSQGAVKAVNLAETPYVNGNFYRDKQVTFGVSEANATNWRSMGLASSDEDVGTGIGYIFVFDEAQTKENTHTLRLSFRSTWGRDLS